MSSSNVAPSSAKYVAPVLTVYGEAKLLTVSGRSGIAENGNQPNCSTNAGRKPC